ncbi:mitochondrial import inner membrane translocase subunit TIM44-like [Tubulanus polymorphus]|uniref:mitochondrial import inner membrane translocase subunit TIM44-like n=1 Tax=Tubulanus polymorphus TaxID=672921 RepID=UPI003DA36A88
MASSTCRPPVQRAVLYLSCRIPSNYHRQHLTAAARSTHHLSSATNISSHDGHVSAIPQKQHRNLRLYQVRYMSQQEQRKGFIKGLLDNIKQEFNKNKEMKESLKKFREEAEKLEQSDALKEVREKYDKMESDTMKSSAIFKEKVGVFKDKLSEQLEEVQKSEFAKKGLEIGQDLGKTATKAAESIGKTGERITQSGAFKTVSDGVKGIKEEIDETTLKRGRVYKPPVVLRKRKEVLEGEEIKPVEVNTEATGMVMHKDSKFFQSWQNFKDNNPYVHKVFDLKTKYDESDHLIVRFTRSFTDKVSDLFGGMFSKTEMSEVLTEIVKMDPTFDKEMFLKDCELDIIPNVLESLVRGDLEILKDWCSEATFNVLSTPIKQVQASNYTIGSRVLDISNIDLAAGKMMEQGPVLVISFNAQQIMVIRNKEGKVIEGDPEQIQKVLYVWALCRDQTELDPRAAWRLMDISASSSVQWL